MINMNLVRISRWNIAWKLEHSLEKFGMVWNKKIICKINKKYTYNKDIRNDENEIGHVSLYEM